MYSAIKPLIYCAISLISTVGLLYCHKASYAAPGPTSGRCAPGEVVVGVEPGGGVICQPITHVLRAAEKTLFKDVLKDQKLQAKANQTRSKQSLLKGTQMHLPWIRKVSTSEYEVVKQEWNAFLGDVNKISRSMRVVPYYRQGEQTAVRVSGIRRKSVIYALGVKNGDIVLTINQVNLTTAGNFMKVYQQIKSAEEATVEIIRRKQPITLHYRVVESFTAPTTPPSKSKGKEPQGEHKMTGRRGEKTTADHVHPANQP